MARWIVKFRKKYNAEIAHISMAYGPDSGEVHLLIIDGYYLGAFLSETLMQEAKRAYYTRKRSENA